MKENSGRRTGWLKKVFIILKPLLLVILRIIIGRVKQKIDLPDSTESAAE